MRGFPSPLLFLVLWSGIWLGGCADFGLTTRDEAPEAVAPAEDSVRPAAITHPAPIRPWAEAPDLPPDLWRELRDGIVFAELSNRRISDQRVWLARYPKRVPMVSERGRPFLPEIHAQLAARGLPMDLALLPAVESGYRTEATSHRGAAGMWQFMPGTARRLGLQVDATIDDRRGFSRATRAALDHLEDLAQRYNGDWLLAVAAYNCGAGCVDRALAKARRGGREPTYWDLDLPGETERYVPRWIAMLQEFMERSPGFEPLDPRRQLVQVSVYPPVDLGLAAQMSGIEEETFYRFNARYEKESLLPVVDSVWLPRDHIDSFHERIAALTPEERARRTRYRVQRGDSLWKIARKHAVTVDYLCRINGFSSRTTLHPGQVLKLVEVN